MKAVMYLVLGCLLAGSLLYGCGWVVDGVPCQLRGSKMGFETDWGVMTGCMVNVHGQWMPIGSYRGVVDP